MKKKKNEIILELDPSLESDLVSISEIKNIDFDILVNKVLKDFVTDNYRLIKERNHLDRYTRLTLSKMK